jgi:hypothetical protein
MKEEETTSSLKLHKLLKKPYTGTSPTAPWTLSLAAHRQPAITRGPYPSPLTGNPQSPEDRGSDEQSKEKNFDFDSSLALFKQRKDKNIWEYTQTLTLTALFHCSSRERIRIYGRNLWEYTSLVKKNYGRI